MPHSQAGYSNGNVTNVICLASFYIYQMWTKNSFYFKITIYRLQYMFNAPF